MPTGEACIKLDGKKRKLLLQGNCLELGQQCQAMCCRLWVVPISAEEYASGLYAAEQTCALTSKACDGQVAACTNRLYHLKRDAEETCVHLDENNRCRIYEHRPQVCRGFTCKGGWWLHSVFPIEEAKGKTSDAVVPAKQVFVERLTDDATFVLHPLIKLHTVFYTKAKGEIRFVKQIVGACGEQFYTRDDFQCPKLNDDLLVQLVHLFDSKSTLGEILRSFCERHEVALAKSEFFEIVWLLNAHNIILDARSLYGTLAGVRGA